MKMNSFRRGWRSLARKPLKSLLLLGAVMVISLLVLCSLSVRSATVAANDSTRQAVGASFLLEINTENRAQRLAAASAKIGEQEGTADGVHQEKVLVNGQEMWSTWQDNSFETLLADDINALAQTEGIADHTITTAPQAVRPLDFARIEDADADQSGDEGGVALIGERAMRLNTNVADGIITLAAGRWITPEDNHACVISEALAEKNQLTLGDALSFTGFGANGSTQTATIVGIFQEAQPMTPYMSGDTYRAENVIFCDLDLPTQVTGEGALYEQAIFAVSDVDDYDAVKAALVQTPIDWSRYDLIDNNGNLETMAANFGSLSESAGVLLALSLGCGLAMLLFVLAFWVHARRRELGILRALGLRRGAVWRQLLGEALAVSMVALVLSFAAAPLVSDVVATKMAVASAEQDRLARAADALDVATDYVAPEISAQRVTTTLSPEMLATDAAAVAALVTLAVSTTTALSLHRKPRELLQSMR